MDRMPFGVFYGTLLPYGPVYGPQLWSLFMSHHYSRRVLPVLLPLFALALLAGGCGGGEKPEPKEALLAEWAAMAKADAATLDPAKAEQLGLRLAKHGPEALNPIVDTLAGPGANPVAQMLAVAALNQVVDTPQEARLLELSGAGHDPATRGCAAHLLGALEARGKATPAVAARLRELMQDPDAHVRNATILVRMLAQDAEGIEKALALWVEPGTPPRVREQIILGIPMPSILGHFDLVMKAMRDEELTVAARSRAVDMLGRIGDATVLEALLDFAANAPDPSLKSMAQAAAEAVKSRVDQGIVVMAIPPPPLDGQAAAPAESAPAETAPAPEAQPAPAPAPGS